MDTWRQRGETHSGYQETEGGGDTQWITGDRRGEDTHWIPGDREKEETHSGYLETAVRVFFIISFFILRMFIFYTVHILLYTFVLYSFHFLNSNYSIQFYLIIQH